MSNEFSLVCKKCGHEWSPRKSDIKRCPSCKSVKWNGGDLIELVPDQLERPTVPLEVRFWEKVDKTTTPDGCWTWNACRGHGYGYIGRYVDGVWDRSKAAIVSWELAHGKRFPSGMILCHRCNNPPCVRPDHLYAGTYATNNQDTVNSRHKNAQKGEDNWKAVLTWEQVREIRNLYANKEGFYRKASVSQRSLATKFGVSRRTIRAALSHSTWKG